MKCPFCKKEDEVKVLDSRSAADGFAIRRRRHCARCNRRWTTYERIEQTPIKVVKKDGRRVPFERGKILAGIEKACEKRPVPTDAFEDLTEKIERRIYDKYDREVPSSVVGQMLMEELRKLDRVAYVRFASVYREFQDVSEFVDAAQETITEPEDSSED
ncbi:MAG: transcriptional regulator NrdR [Planctomycetota bacterium]